jgi:hypothetical protein
MLWAVVKSFASPTHRLQKPLHSHCVALQATRCVFGWRMSTVLIRIHAGCYKLHLAPRVPDSDTTQLARYALGCVCGDFQRRATIYT